MTEALNIIQSEHGSLWRLLSLLDNLNQGLDHAETHPDEELFNLIFDYFEFYPDRMHHPKENDYLFAALQQRAPEAIPLINELRDEHERGPQLLEQLRQDLSYFISHFPEGREAFRDQLQTYIRLIRDHIHKEEERLMPLAQQHLQATDWTTINRAFADNDDPLFGESTRAEFRALHRRIAHMAPDPLGLGLQPLLVINQLSSHYGRIQALREIDLHIHEGELVALVGANGAGKTTLLCTISGLQSASGGDIQFQGRDITRLRADQRVAMGICQCPEGRQVFGPLSVEDNLRLGAYTRGKDRTVDTDITRMYELFPILKEKRRLAAGTLSGGQQQMLAIGRALMGKPKLLLLDEPSLGLAPLLVEEIFAVITELKSQGITIFLVEQNAHAALSIADRGYVIETGSIVLSDQGADLLDNEQVKQAYLGL